MNRTAIDLNPDLRCAEQMACRHEFRRYPVSEVEAAIKFLRLQAINSAFRVLQRVERPRIGMLRIAFALGILCIFFLKVTAVWQQEPAKFHRRFRTINR
ncbi:MAG: hypothetical protein KAH44_03630, partial [Oricola sp.]|nr:hypothetical protein [Oricola sp.]